MDIGESTRSREDTYDLSFFAKSALPEEATITAQLQNADGTSNYATRVFKRLAPGWHKYTGRMTAKATDPKGLALEVTAGQPGTLWLDVVSLFLPTWKGRPNGTRPDSRKWSRG